VRNVWHNSGRNAEEQRQNSGRSTEKRVKRDDYRWNRGRMCHVRVRHVFIMTSFTVCPPRRISRTGRAVCRHPGGPCGAHGSLWCALRSANACHPCCRFWVSVMDRGKVAQHGGRVKRPATTATSTSHVGRVCGCGRARHQHGSTCPAAASSAATSRDIPPDQARFGGRRRDLQAYNPLSPTASTEPMPPSLQSLWRELRPRRHRLSRRRSAAR